MNNTVNTAVQRFTRKIPSMLNLISSLNDMHEVYVQTSAYGNIPAADKADRLSDLNNLNLLLAELEVAQAKSEVA